MLGLRTRKLIGALMLFALVAVWSLIVVGFAPAVLPRVGQLGTLLYHAAAGLLWVPLAWLIIRWMHKA